MPVHTSKVQPTTNGNRVSFVVPSGEDPKNGYDFDFNYEGNSFGVPPVRIYPSHSTIRLHPTSDKITDPGLTIHGNTFDANSGGGSECRLTSNQMVLRAADNSVNTQLTSIGDSYFYHPDFNSTGSNPKKVGVNMYTGTGSLRYGVLSNNYGNNNGVELSFVVDTPNNSTGYKTAIGPDRINFTTASSFGKIYMNEQSQFIITPKKDGGPYFTFKQDGDAVTSGEWVDGCDSRFKENVATATSASQPTLFLDKLNQLRVVTYNRLGESDSQHGFIAQEVQSIFPTAITTFNLQGEEDHPTDPDMRIFVQGEQRFGIKNRALTALTIAAIQQLDNKVDAISVASGATSEASTFTWDAHMIPDTNAAYDLGTAEKKVRHLFLSDNSIKFGDAAIPLGVNEGDLEFGGVPIMPRTLNHVLTTLGVSSYSDQAAALGAGLIEGDVYYDTTMTKLTSVTA